MTRSTERLHGNPQPERRKALSCWEMPGRITKMESLGGRLFVHLADGRTIDMTDAFPNDRERKQ